MKAKLTVTVNDQTKAYALPEQGVKIGRDPGQCQLALQDGDVSSLHAFLSCKKGVWTLQDLGSTNGTFVNGDKVTTVGLKSGDRIKFGSVSAKIEIEEAKKEIETPKTEDASPVRQTKIEVDNSTPPPEMSADDVELIKLLNEKFNLAKENLSQVVIGQMDVIELVLAAIFARGHVLLMGVPGLAKTLLISTLSQVLDLKFKRVQFTPDLMPSDITGTDVLEEDKESGTRQFRFVEGPVFTNMLLADEINRTPPKTQAALLEAMQEHHITVGTKTYNLPEPFFVMATQNPIEQEGTYELSEAQQDRFLLKEVITYPNVKDEVEILNRIEGDVFTASKAVVTIEDIEFLQGLCKKVYISPAIKKYIVDIVQATRDPAKYISPNLANYIAMGSSTRAAIAFMEVSKAVALIQGRAYVTPDDVKAMRHEVMRHRIMLNFAAIADGVKEETIVDAIVGAIVTP